MEKTTIEIMKLAQALTAANEIYCDLKKQGAVLGVYFHDDIGRPAIQLGLNQEGEWGEKSRYDDELDEISTDIFGVKIFLLVYHKEQEAGDNAKMAI